MHPNVYKWIPVVENYPGIRRFPGMKYAGRMTGEYALKNACKYWTITPELYMYFVPTTRHTL